MIVNANENPYLMEEKTIDNIQDYAENLLYSILVKAGDGVHLLQFQSTGVEPLSYFYGKDKRNLYSTLEFNELLGKVMARVKVIKNFVIILESHPTLDPVDPKPSDFEEAGVPDSIVGWLVINNNIIPLTSDQIFDYYYSDKNEITDDDLALKPRFSNAWDLHL